VFTEPTITISRKTKLCVAKLQTKQQSKDLSFPLYSEVNSVTDTVINIWLNEGVY